MNMAHITEKGATRLMIRSGVVMIRSALNMMLGHVNAFALPYLPLLLATIVATSAQQKGHPL